MSAAPVVVSIKPCYSSESLERLGGEPDSFQLEVSERSEPDDAGRVYQKLVDVRQHPRRAALSAYARKAYGDRIVDALDLSPAVA